MTPRWVAIGVAARCAIAFAQGPLPPQIADRARGGNGARERRGVKAGRREARRPPSGMALTSEEQVEEFDGIEAESKQNREHAAQAAFDQYKSGTMAPVFEMEAAQKLLRLHMQEPAFIYGRLLLNR